MDDPLKRSLKYGFFFFFIVYILFYLIYFWLLWALIWTVQACAIWWWRKCHPLLLRDPPSGTSRQRDGTFEIWYGKFRHVFACTMHLAKSNCDKMNVESRLWVNGVSTPGEYSEIYFGGRGRGLKHFCKNIIAAVILLYF